MAALEWSRYHDDVNVERNSMTADSATPMMAQYLALKSQAGDCLLFYRMGDFFELFFEDAKVAAACLDIALTARGEHQGSAIPMCGVPVHAAEAYLARLIKAGHRVAIAEQTESPAEAKKRGGSKALVGRAIVRVVTAGTLTEEALLDARAANWLVAVHELDGEIGIAAADISTGRFETGLASPATIDAELARLGAAELIVSEGWSGAPPNAWLCPKSGFDSLAAETKLKQIFGVATLDGFGGFARAELAAVGGLLAYLDRAGQGTLPFLQPPARRETADHMLIDAATRESLEIVAVAGGGRKGSLLDVVDRTVTGAGARLLAADLSAPLASIPAIHGRLELVDAFVREGGVRDRLRSALRALPDVGRALGRIAAGRGSPRDLGQLRDGLDQGDALRDLLATIAEPPRLLESLVPPLTGHGELVDLLTRALVPMPPIDSSDGGYIAEGYDAALDDLRATSGDGRRAIAALEARYRELTSISALKIRHNGVLGYHIEVPAKHADPLMAADSGFTHRQTLAGVVRFNAPDLHEQAMKVAQAGAHALAAEAAHLEELIAAALARAGEIAATADALARLDTAAALAERAVEGGWCRPDLVDQPCLEIEAGRHPVVEQAVAKTGARFVANDCRLSSYERLWLVTGPNMGGKSTFLRQNALIAILAQAGSFVPASKAKLGLVDRLFSRVGASDNLARGRSTFMVEMVETAAILAQATERSFVILDEVGRGTSTYDGLAIAWAVVEAVHDINRCRCLFATHYHELTRLAERLDALSLHHVRAREWKGELVLLHELAGGPADRSYGIAVAKLAGLPPAVLARARDVLKKLEAGKAATGGLAAGLDDLPLFAATVKEEPQADALRDALHSVDVDSLSPRDALDLVYRLKRVMVGEG
jgi:DNA mismatch repair protein MutS